MPAKDVRKKWTEQSKEYLDEAQVLVTERMGNLLVVTKLYHSLIYSLFGFYNLDDAGSFSHAELIDRFEKVYAGKDRLNISVVNSLRSLYPFVHTCGLPGPPEPDDKYIRTTFDIAVTFLKKVSSLSP